MEIIQYTNTEDKCLFLSSLLLPPPSGRQAGYEGGFQVTIASLGK